MWLRMMRRWLVGAAVVLAVPADALYADLSVPVTGMAAGGAGESGRSQAESGRDGDAATTDAAAPIILRD